MECEANGVSSKGVIIVLAPPFQQAASDCDPVHFFTTTPFFITLSHGIAMPGQATWRFASSFAVCERPSLRGF